MRAEHVLLALSPFVVLGLDRLALTFQGPLGASPWYPSLGFALALGAHAGWRALGPVLVGFLLAAVFVWTTPVGPTALYGAAVKSLVGIGAGVWLGRDPAVRGPWWPPATVLRFLGIAVAMALTTTALGNLPYLANAAPDPLWRRLGGWAAGDFVGVFVFGPVFILLVSHLTNRGRLAPAPARVAEFLGYLVIVGGFVWAVLLTPWGWHYNLLFLSFVIIVIAAMRMGFAATVWLAALIDAAVLLTVGLTRAETVMHADPVRLYILQLFIATLAGVAHILGSTIEGYRRLGRELEAHRQHLEELIAERTRQLAGEVEERRRTEEALAEANALLEARLDERERALLAAMREAEQASRAKTRFLQNLSHELRTPLNAIVGFGTMMLSGMRGPLRPAVYRDYVQHMVEAGEHLKQLVERLLNVEQADDVSNFETCPVDAAAVARQSIDLMTPAARARGARLVLRAGRGLPPVLGEPARLKQVLLNLIDNALKYGPRGQTVTVSLAREDAAGADKAPDGAQHRVVIMVDDEGPGVPPAMRERIFERFGRLNDPEVADSPPGLGIGLYVVRRIVEAMGGTIHVTDAPGGGARFVVRLKIASAPEKP